jgi:hypothetical protein
LIALPQQKMVAPGQIRSWEVDLEAMARCAPWASRNPDLLRDEVGQLLAAFPTFIAAAGSVMPEARCWVEAAEPLLCPGCNELCVFDRGLRCAHCGDEQPPGERPIVGLVGRIPAIISGRPFARSLDSRLARMRAAGDPRAASLSESVLTVGGRRYLAPRFGIWFSQTWPHADPPVMVWAEYFVILDILPDHVYHADPFFRLCLYANWREQPAVRVLQNRVVPRLLIDLMVADLQAIGRLEEALDRLDISLYTLYNLVGRPEAESLRRVYEELMPL